MYWYDLANGLQNPLRPTSGADKEGPMSAAPWIIGVPASVGCVLYYVLTNPEVFSREARRIVDHVLQPFLQYVGKLFGI